MILQILPRRNTCKIRRVHQDPEEKKNLSGFFDFRVVHQDPEEEKKSKVG